MSYWPNIVNWILPSSSSSSSSEFNEDDDEISNQSPNDINDDVVSCDPLADIDSVASPIPDPSSSTSKRRRSEENDEISKRVVSQKRVWTKEDELDLLHGFLDHASKKRHVTNGRNTRDQISSFFVSHVSPELKLRFSKNQIVDKLRRLKKKYRNDVTKNSEFRFKNSHDKATFEICRDIWKSYETTGRLSPDEDEINIVTIPKTTRPQTRAESKKKNADININGTTSIDHDGSDTVGLIMDLGLNNIIELMKFYDDDDNNDDEDEDNEQKIIELEDYLKKLELVQTKVKAVLDKLKAKLD